MDSFELLHEGQRRGSIEVVCGSMFSGKTEELIRRVKRVQFAHLKLMCFKPTIDIRYSREDVVSHDQTAISAIPVENARIIPHLAKDAEVVAIDEAQFFDDNLMDVCNELANEGKRVIVAGLDMDYKGYPFGPMPKVMAVADSVYKAHAICVKCGALANFSFRTAESEELVLLGEKAEYQPLCRCCFNKYINQNKK